MTGGQAADVTVSVHRTSTCTRVEFRARAQVPPVRLTLMKQGALDEARRELDRGLLRLKDVLPSSTGGEPDYAEVHDTLHRLGRRLFSLLFGTYPDIVRGLQDFWRRAVPFGRNPALPPPLVECVGDADTFLPLELLPLYAMHPGPPPATRDEFVVACRALVGFSCMVRRVMRPTALSPELSLRAAADRLLPVRFLQFDALDGARAELDWFSSAAAHRVRLEGPYPAAPDAPPQPGLAEQIYDPRLLLAGGVRDAPDQIQHFACHCYATSDTPLDNEIHLRGGGREVQATLGALSEDLVALGAGPAVRDCAMPLVVMNACGSARMHATSSLSFPDFFLKNGNRGFIGSEIEIPDDVAAAFSKALYERFLLRRLPLGRAVLEARNQLLHDVGNPLGIVYAAYADPQMHVHADHTEGNTHVDSRAAAEPRAGTESRAGTAA